jgi:hypothetical protein
MKQLLQIVQTLVILGLTILLIQKCNNEDKPRTITRVEIIQGDTIMYTYKKDSLIPYAVYYPKYLTDTTYVYDTVYILHDYNTVKWYRDTTIDDTALFIAWELGLSNNALDSLTIHWQNRRIKSVVITHELEPRNGVYLGVDLGHSIVPKVAYRSNKWIMEAGYDITNKQLEAGIKLQLWQH